MRTQRQRSTTAVGRDQWPISVHPRSPCSLYLRIQVPYVELRNDGIDRCIHAIGRVDVESGRERISDRTIRTFANLKPTRGNHEALVVNPKRDAGRVTFLSSPIRRPFRNHLLEAGLFRSAGHPSSGTDCHGKNDQPLHQ